MFAWLTQKESGPCEFWPCDWLLWYYFNGCKKKEKCSPFFTNQEEETNSHDVITSLVSKNIYNCESYNFIPSFSPKVYQKYLLTFWMRICMVKKCPYISKILFINLPSEGINTKYIKKDFPIRQFSQCNKASF